MHKYLINRITTPLEYTNDKEEPTLNVMEFFYDTIQGEGASIGSPAAFLRLQGCTLDCVWCFYSSTRITTKSKGKVFIKDVKEGEILITLDNKENIVETVVQQIMQREASVDELMAVYFDKKDQPTLVTKNHRFYVKNKGWMAAIALCKEDVIYSLHGVKYRSERMKINNPSFNSESLEKGKKTQKRLRAEGIIVPYERSFEVRKANSERMKIHNPSFDKEVQKRSSMNRFNTPSKLELKYDQLFEDLNLPIKYIGNNKLAIGSKEEGYRFPDFVIMGTKKVIEIYDSTMQYLSKTHGRKKRDKSWKIERSLFFKKYEYDVLFFNEQDIKIKNRNVLQSQLFNFVFNGKRVSRIQRNLTSKQKARLFGDGAYGGNVTVHNLKCHPHNTYLANDCLAHNCDTEWRLGSTFTLTEIFQRMNVAGLPEKLRNGQRLILTGGSPLKQEKMLRRFIYAFVKKYKFKPIIEIENECTLFPNELMISLVDQWNNSPKLANSGMKKKARYKPDVIRTLSSLKNSWFKFVVECEEDWEEIQKSFLDPELIRKDQIILMPLAADYDELQKTNRIAMEMAVKHGVRFTTREQLVLQVP